MKIDFKDYLNDSEIKEIVSDELRKEVREMFKNESNSTRILSNMAYSIIQEEVDKIVPNHKELIIQKTAELIKGKDLSYHVFNYNYNDGKPHSLGAKIIDETIIENKQVIKDLVVKSFQEKDYSEDIFSKFESLADDFSSNIYQLVENLKQVTIKPKICK